MINRRLSYVISSGIHSKLLEITRITRNDTRNKTVNNNNKNNRVFYLLQNNEVLKGFFQKIFVANKRDNNLKILLLRSDPYNIKRDLLDSTKLE